jgi:hypothetical protein
MFQAQVSRLMCSDSYLATIPNYQPSLEPDAAFFGACQHQPACWQSVCRREQALSDQQVLVLKPDFWLFQAIFKQIKF